MRKLAIAVAIVWSAAAAWADETLILKLDTGGHLSLIRGLSFTPDGKFIVSAGDDKVPDLGLAGGQVRAGGLRGYVQDRVKALVAQLKVSTQEPAIL